MPGIPDIGSDTLSKKTRVWIIEGDKQTGVTWKPKKTPKLYYDGQKGDARFVIECSKGNKLDVVEIKLISDVFTIR